MERLTQRLSLKEVQPTDLREVHALHCLPEVDRYNTLGIPGSEADTAALLAQWIEQQIPRPQLSYVFCLRLNTTQQFIGLIALTLGKPKYRNAEVWYKLLPQHWGQGYTTEALKDLLDFGFETLQLHRITAGCASGNTASMRVLEKAGMIPEGCERKVLPIRGEWVDSYAYAILDQDPR